MYRGQKAPIRHKIEPEQAYYLLFGAILVNAIREANGHVAYHGGMGKKERACICSDAREFIFSDRLSTFLSDFSVTAISTYAIRRFTQDAGNHLPRLE